ncbi:conserved repeat domain-containing protein [Clostridium cavendishii DSM 21758]|uniref:Conserved repeat domain-containing protein n=1 Tax=Clostridium cavendishii DSM 21758 TaxID=1121302 RepID=A0A1M6JHY2_9CLOT|nr:SPOCS domain-containing protein [Clostridium cavendishii]SHJ46273.1 conserved repeat domain-containing protein [Clostridium cavendishii DSM 21758]
MSLNNIEEHGSDLIIKKAVNAQDAIVGDILRYKITVINKSKKFVDNVIIIDPLISELEFINGSVILEESNLLNENILAGVHIGCLKPDEIKILSFDARILSKPKIGYIENSAIVKFCYENNSVDHSTIMDTISNTVSTRVDIADIKIIKKANKKVVSIGELISYEVNLINVGTLQARNILFKDKLPSEVNLVDNSFKINGNRVNSINDYMEIYVGTINPSENIIISYDVIVKASNCSGILINKSYIKFNYNLPKGRSGEKKCVCKSTEDSEVKLGISTFKLLSVYDNLCIPEDNPDIEEVNDINVDTEILKYYIIRTPSVTSNEGQKLTGYKLVVRGLLRESIEYTAKVSEQSIHFANFSIPFSTFIILPNNFKVDNKIDVRTNIKDIYFKKVNKRELFKNITLLINVKIISY